MGAEVNEKRKVLLRSGGGVLGGECRDLGRDSRITLCMAGSGGESVYIGLEKLSWYMLVMRLHRGCVQGPTARDVKIG